MSLQPDRQTPPHVKWETQTPQAAEPGPPSEPAAQNKSHIEGQTKPQMEPQAEPWMRGPLRGVHPFIAPLFYSFQMAREDLAKYTAGLTTDQIWATPHSFGSVGFHLRHIAGSADRLTTYITGGQLSDAQLTAIKKEKEPGATREMLLADMHASFESAEAIARTLDPAHLADPRSVGRKQLPTTVIGLLVHLAEHTQRHVGQAIIASKWAQVGR